MFLFTKTRNGISPDYQKLEDVETREPSPSDTETFYQTSRRRDYRTAFYGLSIAYLLTIIIGLSLWKLESNTDSSAAGHKIINTGKGFVQVDGHHYCISMFHQLHCIATLKTAFEAGNLDNEHLGHCFDYLRQGVMCAGDMTLEPVLRLGTDGDEVQVVDGWGVEHRCRSFESMVGFAEGHRYLNSTGIH
ncbi:Oxidase ustYa [Lachnellula arida]|uniref:Oxidase ustYa n=1 Tax=Lachnellula arida TaxID=1316785 RepID=A0A8T9B2H8_9HELO|nr:Oxidase ustYa [Lachnellula arida]